MAQKEDEEQQKDPRERTTVAASEEPMSAPFDFDVNRPALVLGL